MFVALAAVAGASLAGCTTETGPATTPSMTTASPSPTVTPTSTPSPTSTDSRIAGTVVDLTDPELGIVFTDVPDLSGDEADVYNWATTYEVERWRSMAANAVSPAFTTIASPEVQARVAQMVAANADVRAQIGGTLQVRVLAITVEDDTAEATVCEDYSAVTFTDVDGPDTPEEAGFGEPQKATVTLRRAPEGEGVWIVAGDVGAGTC